MVGVKIYATHMKTRKTNCDKIQEKVKNVIGPCKWG